MSSVSLKNAIVVSSAITCAALRVHGEIPSGASLTVEVTNNFNDASPVWENCTSETEHLGAHVFKHTGGRAFNFRVTCERGSSGGGHIDLITGRFE